MLGLGLGMQHLRPNPGAAITPFGPNIIPTPNGFTAGDGWTIQETTVTAGATPGPGGVGTASSAIPTAVAGLHNLVRTLSANPNVPWRYELICKPIGLYGIRLHLGGGNTPGTDNILASYRLETGELWAPAVNNGGASGAAASIEPLADGYFRCILEGTPDGGASTVRAGIFHLSETNVISFAGDTTSGVYLYSLSLRQIL